MSKSARNLIIFWLIIFGVAFCAMMGKFIISAIPKAENKEIAVSVQGDDESLSIKSAQELYDVIQNYSASYSNKHFILDLEGTGTDKFDMSEFTLDRTLGTEANPFSGKFDGQGYEITNLKFDFSGTQNSATNKYVGLFGVTNGAEISNLYISGVTTFKVGSCTNLYVGAVAGNAIDTEFSYIQNVSRIVFQDDILDKNLNFGSFAGQLTNCQTVNYIVSRCASVSNAGASNLNFVSNASGIYNIGGFVGYASNAALTFCVSAFNANITFADTFRGTVNLGGIAGVVQHNASKIINYTFDNNIDIDDTNLNVNSEVNVGEVVGKINNSAVPSSGNLCYIYYHTASNNPVFGYMGAYSYVDAVSRDNIVKEINPLSSVSDYESRQWFVLGGEWDFNSVWYFTSSTGMINLQCCYGDFSVNIGTNLNSKTVVEIKDDELKTKYRYGKSAQIKFGFVEIDDGEEVIDMQKYYTLASVTKDGREANFFVLNDDEYSFQDQNYLKFETLSTGEFVLTIENINLSHWGVFDIAVTAKKFDVSVTSKLFDKNGEVDEEEIPADVSQQGGTNNEKFTIKMAYDEKATLKSSIKKDAKPCVFEGWYLVGDSEDTLISNSANLPIVFGHGIYDDSIIIYARYNDDACSVTFILDDGVKGITCGTTYYTKEELNKKPIALSKTATSMKIEIYIVSGYKFDSDEFIKSLDTYKSSDTTRPFCKHISSTEDGTFYEFILDMTTLTGDFAEKFNIDVKTTKEKVAGNAMIWYIVGGTSGVVVIAGIVVLIIILKRRSGGFGGGSSKSSFNKKGFKDMYY